MAISYPVSLPAGASPRIITLKGVNESSITESPFTAEQQVQSFPVDRWQAEIEYPPMDRAAAEVLNSRLLALYGAGGVVYLGDSSSSAPRGVATGTPLISGASQAGKILLVSGCTPSVTGWLKEGDWLQFGYGLNATRIQTSGGSQANKYAFGFVIPSVNGQKYVTRVRISNSGAKAVTVFDSIGGSQTVAAGAVDVQVSMISTGDGVQPVQPIFAAPLAADSLDFVAWDIVIQRFGFDENLVTLSKRDFSGWNMISSAVVTLTQALNQRLHKLVNADANSDSGGFAALDLWPRMRESPISGYPITLASPKGLFRVASDSIDWTIDEALKFGIKFSAMEAY
jgi:hypothetical protein